MRSRIKRGKSGLLGSDELSNAFFPEGQHLEHLLLSEGSLFPAALDLDDTYFRVWSLGFRI